MFGKEKILIRIFLTPIPSNGRKGIGDTEKESEMFTDTFSPKFLPLFSSW